MNQLDVAFALNLEGRFKEALAALNHSELEPRASIARSMLRAELLERTGRFGQSRAAIEYLYKSKGITAREQSSCEFVLGKIDWEEGATESALTHLQRSVTLASDAGDLRRKCWPNMSLLLAVSDSSGPNAAAPILSELRSDALKLGDPQVLVALHAAVAKTEAKRGLFDAARIHLRLGQNLLLTTPNLWLEALIESTSATVALLMSDFDSARICAQRALEFAQRSGSAATQRTCLGNLAFLSYSIGQFEQAVNFFERAIAALPSSGENHNGMLETLARIRLKQGRTQESEALLDELEDSIKRPQDRIRYTYRHAVLTRAHLRAREGRLLEALDLTDRAIALASEAGDHWLWNLAQLSKAHLLQQDGRATESLTLLEPLLTALVSQSPDLYAQYEMILGCALASVGQRDVGSVHRMRAERLYASLRHAPGLLELSRCWDAAVQTAHAPDNVAASPGATTAPRVGTQGTGSVLQAVAAVMVQAGRPEFMAHELLDLLAQTGCVRRAVALLGDSDNEPETLATIGEIGEAPLTAAAWPRRLVIGSVRDRSVELWLEPNEDLESIATINAVALLLSTVREIEKARAEREQRLTLWPIDDTLLDDGQAVVGGRMRELMTYAKRIATTNVSVLITGESGTGKEILARAVHSYSDSAAKPFIPFNCAAVPREMLESQLFGHRRGAFTSADRDNPGVIRTAQGGTLFLDEIGELSLDLQPKLLRFLESGEICPLGESTPFTVNLRVVAATNSNLEQAVKDGRFREDLFYRLNVVRLQIPPLRERRDEIPALVRHFLAKAAADYRKGHLRIAEDTMEQLLLFPWPGNIRQLHNELRRMVALAEPGTVLTPDVLSVEIANAKAAPVQRPGGAFRPPSGEKLKPVLDRVELEMIKVALREHNGKVDDAAKALGISRKGLYLKRQRLGL